MQVETE